MIETLFVFLRKKLYQLLKVTDCYHTPSHCPDSLSILDYFTASTGVIVTLQAAIGSATPPFGCDIFTAIAIFRRPYLEIIRGTPPFIAILLLASVILITFPEISLFLRDLAFGE